MKQNQQSSFNSNKKLVVKNTLALYFRMGVTMVIALFTSREVLRILGVENYGIFGVVGALVSTFSVFSSNLRAASQRFLSFELGRNDGDFKRIFSVLLGLHLIAAIVLLIIIEFIGSYYIFHYLNVPEKRLNAAFWAFTFSTISFCIKLVTVPYNSAIISNEKFKFYALIGILETLFKLIILYLLFLSSSDRLIVYSFLFMLSGITINIVTLIYSITNFNGCKTFISFDKKITKEIGKFLGWNGLGTLAFILREQGVALLFNYFFGPIVNAAYSLTNQVRNAVTSFSKNFIVALNPQITKLCAAKNFKDMSELIHLGSKISYLFMLILCLPVILNIDYILNLWLDKVPAYATSFICLSLTFETFKSLQSPLSTAILASGKVKKYNLYWGGINLSIFPLSLILFKIGFNPNYSYVVSIICSFFILFAMMKLYKAYFNISYKTYFSTVINYCLRTTIVSLTLNAILMYYHPSSSIIEFMINIMVNFLLTGIIIYFLGLNRLEKSKIILIVKEKINLILKAKFPYAK